MPIKKILFYILYTGTVTCFSYLVALVFIKDPMLRKIKAKINNHQRYRIKPVNYPYAWMMKMNDRYIEKTNIKRYIGFMDLPLLLALELGIIVIIFFWVIIKGGSITSALLLALFAAMIPLFALDFLAAYNLEKTQKDLASFVSVLARWSSVKNNVFYAFEKALESGLNEPLNTFVRDLTVQVRCGINPEDALDLFSNRLGDREFKDAILNIKQNVRFRGDANTLLTNMESRFYRMQEERNKRKISTLGDRTMIVCTIASVLGLAMYFLKSNDKISNFYLHDPSGKILLVVLYCLFLFGMILFMNITKIKE